MECECLLYDHAIRIARCRIAAKAEIAKAVADVFSVVFFNALEHMWVVSDYKVCTFINGEMCKSLLVLVRCILLFNSPMEIYDDNLSTGFFQCFDILFYLRCTFLVIRKLIDSGNTNFDSFYFEDLHPVITKGSNSGIVQCGDCIGVALLPIVMTVVISEIGRFDGASGKDCSIFGRCFEGKGLGLPGSFICQGSFHIDDRQIIFLENGSDVLEEIVGTV